MPLSSTEIHLARRPSGMAVPEDFSFVTRELPDPGRRRVAGAEPLYQRRSLHAGTHERGPDPGTGFPVSTRSCMGAPSAGSWPPGTTALQDGDLVSSNLGWREGFLSEGDGLQKLPETSLPVTVHMGPLGLTGRTAYDGLLGAAELQKGETVFVSGAAGAVWQHRGSDRSPQGLPHDRQRGLGGKGGVLPGDRFSTTPSTTTTATWRRRFTRARRKGSMSISTMWAANTWKRRSRTCGCLGRVAICGAISHYKRYGACARTFQPAGMAIRLRLTLRGFVVGNFPELREPFERDMRSWLENGQIVWRETIREGIRSTPEAFMGLFTWREHRQNDREGRLIRRSSFLWTFVPLLRP